MKLADFANLNSTAKGGLQVLIGNGLALQVPKALESAVSGLLDRTSVHGFNRADGTVGQTGKLGFVKVDFHLTNADEGLGFLDAIERAELELASAAVVFGAAPAPAAPTDSAANPAD